MTRTATRSVPPGDTHESPVQTAHNGLLDMVERAVQIALDHGLAAQVAARLDRLVPRPAAPPLMTTEQRLAVATAITKLEQVQDRRRREIDAFDGARASLAAILAATKPESAP